MKKILIITEYFAPTQAIASNRWSKIAYYLKQKNDVSITVLTIRRNYSHRESIMGYSLKDNTLLKETKAVDEFLVVDYNSFSIFLTRLFSFVRKRFLKQEWKEKYLENYQPDDGKKGLVAELKRLYSFVLNSYLNLSYYKGAVKKLKQNNETYDYIISTFGPYWPGLVGRYLKKNCRESVWLADFRDYCIRDIFHSFNNKLHALYLHSVCKNADIVTEVVEGMDVEKYAKRKIRVIPNGYDLFDLNEKVKPERFSFVYTGSYYKTRNDINGLFVAIRELVDEGKINVEDIVIVFAGNGFEEFNIRAKQNRLERYTINKGLLSREEALKLQSGAAILIQTGWNTEKVKFLWTGKTYEYMMARKPIVYIVNGTVAGSPPSKHIERIGGVCYESVNHSVDIIRLKNYIEGKYNDWKNTGDVSISRDEKYVEQFSYPNIAEQVWTCLNERK